MKVADEPNVERLRRKAAVLETENERMSKQIALLMRENLKLKGMSLEAIEQNLPGLLEQVTSQSSSSGLTRPSHEGRPREKVKEKKTQRGHGPTPQPALEIIPETFELDEADRFCRLCGDPLERWTAADDEIDLVDSIQRKWVIRKCRLTKWRCKKGCSVETAEGPPTLIKGGRYSVDVAVDAAIAKFDDHLPLERQVKIARREGIQLTTQTLWDQILALSLALVPLCERIRQHILHEPVLGIDLTGFALIEKGGSKKKQVWQLSCPTAIYFEMLDTKKASGGRHLLVVEDNGREVHRFQGTAMMDGAPELLAIAEELGFLTAACWSHARRKVLKADKEAPGQVKEFLELVEDIYRIDRKAARAPPPDESRQGYRHRLDLEQLNILRDTETRDVCQKIQNWMLAQTCIPGGLLKTGLSYVASRWTRLTRFLDDPRIPPDNNRTEASFIGLALGRRNYLGARSQRGTEVAARFYTIVESAGLNGHESRAYLSYADHAACRGETPLLPHEWTPNSRS